MIRRLAALGLAALVGSCSANDAPPRPHDQAAELGGEIAARATAGDVTEAVPVSLVASVASAESVTPEEAARRLVDDAVAAVAARQKGLDRAPPASWLLVAARARFTAEHARAAARAAGPPTDEEVKELSLRHWREVDRPTSVRVVHVVVRRPDKADPAKLERAKALAAELRAALLDAKTPEDFIKQAKAFAHPKEIDVRAEPLPPFTDDGYSIEGPDVFDPKFVSAAHALQEAGATSPVVESSFGWHVIRLAERIPERRMPFESRRLAFTVEAQDLRARRALDAELEPLRAANEVTIAPSAEQLMRSVMSAE